MPSMAYWSMPSRFCSGNRVENCLSNWGLVNLRVWLGLGSLLWTDWNLRSLWSKVRKYQRSSGEGGLLVICLRILRPMRSLNMLVEVVAGVSFLGVDDGSG